MTCFIFWRAWLMNRPKRMTRPLTIIFRWARITRITKKPSSPLPFCTGTRTRPQRAVSFLESHHQQDPKDADIVLYLSSLYERTGELDKALPMLKQSVLDAPENTVLLFRLGTVQGPYGITARLY